MELLSLPARGGLSSAGVGRCHPCLSLRSTSSLLPARSPRQRNIGALLRQCPGLGLGLGLALRSGLEFFITVGGAAWQVEAAGLATGLTCNACTVAEEDGTGALPCRPICVAAPRVKTALSVSSLKVRILRGTDYRRESAPRSALAPRNLRARSLLWARDSLISKRNKRRGRACVTIIWPAIQILAACVAFWSHKFVVWTW